ncbi:hypothetical protein LDENG_00162010, partial [Lucifuga dentata]
SNTERLVHVFITSRLDYCNTLYNICLYKSLYKSPAINSEFCCTSAGWTRRRACITPILKSLHWLPVSFQIDFKILLLVFKVMHGLASRYLSEMRLIHEPLRPLRSPRTLFLMSQRAEEKHWMMQLLAVTLQVVGTVVLSLCCIS